MSLNKQTIGFTFIIFLCLISSAQPKLKLDTFALGYPKPVDIAHDNNTTRLYIVDQQGRIFVLDSNGNKLDTFLDIRSRVQYINNGEEGLLGLAFHPDYKNNGYFYVYHTQKNTTNNAVYRYKVSSNPNRANIDSQKLVISFPHPTFTNHNGGCLKFGRDGFLYIAVGDGGSGGDPNNNAQNKNTFLGKLLRIDVNDFNATYVVPATNPFVGQANVKQEIWAYGLRNPWRFSFDRNTGDLWLADVGQNVVEEVNFHSSFQLNLVSEKNPSCPNISNGSIQLTSTGNNGTVTYNWSNSGSGSLISNLGPDKYVVTATDGIGCIRKDSFTLVNLDTLSIGLLSKQNPSCLNVTNGQISVQALDGFGSITYNWNNGGNSATISGLAPNKYVVTATDSVGCSAKDSFVLVNIDTLDKPIIILSGDTLYTAAGFSYQWKENDTDIAGANQVFYKLILAGSYTVEITDINGCKAISNNFDAIITSLKNKNTDIQTFTLFPNPATNNLTLDIRFHAAKKSTLKIMAML
jgi:hypothetical protein